MALKRTDAEQAQIDRMVAEGCVTKCVTWPDRTPSLTRNIGMNVLPRTMRKPVSSPDNLDFNERVRHGVRAFRRGILG